MKERFPMGKYPKLPWAEFKAGMAEWTDWDWASYLLGRALGMFPPPEEATFQSDLKWVFWTDNPTGRTLILLLEQLTMLGLLEKLDDQWKFKRKDKPIGDGNRFENG